jgi:GNAT superfamily N-acetyltransferase
VNPRSATADEAGALAPVFARALAEDPMIRWPFPQEDDAPVERAQALFTTILALYSEAEVLWAVGELGGAALIPPDRFEMFERMDALSRPAIHPLTDDGGERYDRFWDWLGESVSDAPSWFLDIVAVDPAHQGKGIGTSLIRFGQERARASGVPVVLETANPRNVPYYERLGFHVTRHADAPDGGPHVWFMRCDPPAG